MQHVPILIPLDGYTKLVEGTHDLTPTERQYICVRYMEQFRPAGHLCPLTMDQITDVVCEELGVTRKKLFQIFRRDGPRSRKTAYGRQLVAYFAINLLPHMKLVKIGQFMGGRHHTTIMSYRNRIAGLLDAKDEIATTDAERITEHLKRLVDKLDN